MPTSHDLHLGVAGFCFADLFDPRRLKDLADRFLAQVARDDPQLWEAYEPYWRARGAGYRRPDDSALLIRMAPHLSRFIAQLFGIQAEREEMIRRARELSPVWRVKKELTQRLRRVRRADSHRPAADPDALEQRLHTIQRLAFPETCSALDPELGMALMVEALLDAEQQLAGPAHTATDATGPAAVEPERAAAQENARPHPRDLCRRLRAADPVLASQTDDRAVVREALALVEEWAAAILRDADRRRRYAEHWVLFRVPEPLHYPDGLVEFVRPDAQMPERLVGPAERRRLRDGFQLTDPRWSLKEALDHAHYCLICHERGKDSCSLGYPLPRRTSEPARNPLGIVLGGCPLDERISEMHLLKRDGDSIAALALAMIDNPMCPATGHRICNDCMKACIFQKQEPVNIPQIETRCLTDVLELPWGVEIYGLLTRWNPLNVRRPYPLPYNGKNILVVGLGPAGINLSHWLLQEGFGVVGIDALKIEPPPGDLLGDPASGRPPRPIRDAAEIRCPLDERIGGGFGGVAEYGITVRWDKNFLRLMEITLRRRGTFRVYGGVRFGGTLEIDDAWALGFDHIAIAAGAGRPTVVEMKNTLIANVRTASDFLMALQLTGAFKKDSIANFQVQLPVVIIGGGLTAIDTATEVQAYYPLQVEKILERFEVLARETDEAALWSRFSDEERAILRTFLEHGRAVREERRRAAAEGRRPDFLSLVRRWGGVRICYRKRLVDCPAYRLNHEEIIKCLEEGVEFCELLNPVEAVPGPDGAVQAVRFERMSFEDGEYRPTGQLVTLAARTVLMAAGTVPNIVYEREHPGTFQIDLKRRSFQPHHLVIQDRPELVPSLGTRADPGFFTSYEKDGRFITFYGDNHPVYAGSVVKALASARDGYPQIVRLFEKELAGLRPQDQPAREQAWRELTARLDDLLVARVEQVVRLTPTVVEVVVRAPLAAAKFRPGQFYRLQNFETTAPVVRGTRLHMEGLALTGAWVDRERGLLSLIVLEMGGSSSLCRILRPGEQVVVMGPTGTPTEIPGGGLVVLCGGGLGNAVLLSIARAMKEAGCKVLYFAGYRRAADVFHMDSIERGADQVVWSTDVPPAIAPRRPQDRTFVGNIVQAMLAYVRGDLERPAPPSTPEATTPADDDAGRRTGSDGQVGAHSDLDGGTSASGAAPRVSVGAPEAAGRGPLFDLRTAERIISIGSDRMMAAVAQARRGVLAPWLHPSHTAISSINSPMQCMMKEVCGQCLQLHRPHESGAPQYVFSCFCQDQPSDALDWANLSDRLRMNSVQEKLTSLWLEHILAEAPLVTV